MSRRSKERFYADIDGRSVLLFSIKDRLKKGLVIIGSSSKYTDVDDERCEILEQHFSVHPSNNGIDTTITNKKSIAGKASSSNLSYIKRSDKFLLYPVIAKRLPKYNQDQRNMNKRIIGNRFKIGDFNSSTSCMIYAIFVTNQDFDISSLYLEGANITIRKYHIYNIIIIVSYLNLPTIDDGDFCAHITSTEVFDNIISKEHRQYPAKSLTIEQFGQVYYSFAKFLCEKYFDRTAPFAEEDLQKFLGRQAGFISSYPLWRHLR